MAAEQNSCEQQAELICSFNHCLLCLTMERAGREERSLELPLKMDSACILGGVHKNGAKTHLIHHCLIWAGKQMDRRGDTLCWCVLWGGLNVESAVKSTKATSVYLLPHWLLNPFITAEMQEEVCCLYSRVHFMNYIAIKFCNYAPTVKLNTKTEIKVLSSLNNRRNNAR